MKYIRKEYDKYNTIYRHNMQKLNQFNSDKISTPRKK